MTGAFDLGLGSQDVAMDSGVKLAPTYHFYKDGVKVRSLPLPRHALACS